MSNEYELMPCPSESTLSNNVGLVARVDEYINRREGGRCTMFRRRRDSKLENVRQLRSLLVDNENVPMVRVNELYREAAGIQKDFFGGDLHAGGKLGDLYRELFPEINQQYVTDMRLAESNPYPVGYGPF